MNEEEEKELLSKYIDRSKKFNIFKVLGLQDYEVRHSNFLAWLLNPKGSHNLGDTFLKKFLFLNGESLALNNINISTEYFTYEGKRIDILITGDDFVCVVENKYGSSEHDNQCESYRKFVKKDFENITHKKFIFLDVDENSSAPDEYIKYDYKKNVLQILKEIYSDSDKKEKTSQFDIILQYITVLEEKYEMFNDKKLPSINDKIEDLRNKVEEKLKTFEYSTIYKINNKSQTKPFALEFFPKDCFKDNPKIPRALNNNESCMLSYNIEFDISGIFFKVIFYKSDDERYKNICKQFDLKNIIQDPYYLKREEIIPYSDYIDLLYNSDNRTELFNKIKEYFCNFSETNNQIKNILIS